MTKECLAILSLDLGTTTGWAIRNRQGIVCSGSQSFKPQRFEGGGMRYLRFQRWVGELIAPTQGEPPLIDRVIFEEVRRHLGTDAAHAYGGFMSQLACVCENASVPYEGFPVGAIKRHATGKGNAGKDMMIAAMRARGYTPADDNEADALALLHLGIDSYTF